MKITQTILKEFEELKAIQCDFCKNKYYDIFEIQEFIEITHQCGYGSVFGDSQIINLDICQHCFEKIISTFDKK